MCDLLSCPYKEEDCSSNLRAASCAGTGQGPQVPCFPVSAAQLGGCVRVLCFPSALSQRGRVHTDEAVMLFPAQLCAETGREECSSAVLGEQFGS